MTPERQLTRAERRELKFRGGQMLNRHFENVTGGYLVTHEDPGSGFEIAQAFSSDTSYLRTYSNVAREIADIDQAKKRAHQTGNSFSFTPHPDFPHDFFNAKVLETSLSDIEQLPATQGAQEIKLVIDFYRQVSGLTGISNKTRKLQQVLNCLVTQPFTNPDVHFPIHPRLMRVREKLLPTVEFAKQILYNFSSPESAFRIVGCMNNLVMQTFIYAMENDGISLSSLQKLYLLRIDQSYQGKYAIARPIALRRYKRWLRSTDPVANLFYKNSPPDFYKWNPQVDKRAQEMLLRTTQIGDISDAELQRVYEQNVDLAQNWRTFQREVYPLARKNSIIVESQDEDNLFRRLTITADRPTFTHFILHFKEPNLFLTLDVDTKGRLFGLPPDLAKKFPNADKIIFNHLMTSVMPYLEKTFPEAAEEIRRSKERTINQGKATQTQPSRLTIAAPPSPEKRRAQSTKRKATRSAYEVNGEESTLSPELQEEVAQKEVVKVVNYTYDRVRKLAGKKIAETDLNRIMSRIRRYEITGVPDGILEAEAYHMSGAVLPKLQYGKWRIILLNTSGNFYEVVAVSKRDKAYKIDLRTPASN